MALSNLAERLGVRQSSAAFRTECNQSKSARGLAQSKSFAKFVSRNGSPFVSFISFCKNHFGVLTKKAGFFLALGAVVLFGQVQAEAYVLLGSRWSGSHPRVPYYVSTNLIGHVPHTYIHGNLPLQTFEDGIQAITNAANTWNTQGDSELKFFYAGTTDVGTVGNDGVNTIIYDPNPCPVSGTACMAQAFVWWGPNMLIEGFDIVLYGSNAPGTELLWTARNFVLLSEVDIQTVVLHELGHGLGLGHSTIPSVMGSGAGIGTNSRNLAVDDRDGMQAIYGEYTNEGFWASNPTPSPGDTVTLFLDNPLATGQEYQIVADVDGPGAGCPLRYT